MYPVYEYQGILHLHISGQNPGSPFFFDDAFHAVSIPVTFVLETEAKSIERVLRCPRIIDEEHDVTQIVAVLKLVKEL